jgi:hypothetical protein
MNYHNESQTNLEEAGTYVGLRLTASSRSELLTFCQKKKIELNAIGNSYERRMHTTVFYSYQKPQNTDLGSIHGKVLAIRARAKGWKVLPRQGMDEKQCLVLEIEAPDLECYHQKIIETTGIKHVFNPYIPHITMDYEFLGQIPEELPEFEILFQELYVKHLFY